MSSEGSCRFAVSSSKMCDVQLEDQLDYEPDDQYNDKIDENIEHESVKSFKSTSEQNFEKNFGKFRMEYIKHVDIEQDSVRSSYIPHVLTNMYDDPSVSTFIDSSSEEGDLDDPEDINLSDDILLNASRRVDVQNNNSEALKRTNLTNDSLNMSQCNFLPTREVKVSSTPKVPFKKALIEPPELNSSPKLIIQSVISSSKLDTVRVTTSHASKIDPEIRQGTSQTTKSALKNDAVTVQNFCISISTNSTTRTVKATVIQPEQQTQNIKNSLESQSHGSILTNLYAPPVQHQGEYYNHSYKRLWTSRDYSKGMVKLSSKDNVISWESEEPPAKRFHLDSYCSSNSGSFKVPLRRPPTRKISIEPPQIEIARPEEKVEAQKHEDDLISIFAGTSILDPDEKRDEIIDKDKEINAIGKIDLVQHWLATNDYDDANEYDTSSSTNNDNINTSAETTPANNNNTEKPHTQRDVFPPQCFKGLCFFYFFNLNGRRCTNSFCNRVHNLKCLPPGLEKLHEEPENRLLAAYNYAKKHAKFYCAMLNKFCESFAMKKMFSQMIVVVEHIFDPSWLTVENFSRVIALKNLCDSFVKGSFGNLYETVQYILDQCLQRVSELGDVMTEVIIERSDLPIYWPLIKEVILAQKLTKQTGIKLLFALKKSSIDRKIANDVLRLGFIDTNEPHTREILNFFKKTGTPDVSPKKADEKLYTSSEETTNNINFVDSPSIQGVFGNYPVFPNTGRSFEQGNFEISGRDRPVFGSITKVRDEERYGRSSQQAANFEILAKDQPDFGSLIKTREETKSHSINLENSNRNQSHFVNRTSDREGWRMTPSAADFESDFAIRRGLRDEDRKNDIFDSLRDQSGEFVTRTRPEPKLNFEPPNPQNRLLNTYTYHDVKPSRKRNIDSDSDSGTIRGFSDNECLSEHEKDRRPTVQRNPKIVGSRKCYIEKGLHYDPLHDYVDKAVSSNISPFNFGEAIVSSSSDQKSIQKPPEHPKFGQMCYDPHYIFNVSLHNFYLQKLENIDINEDDVLRLNDAVKFGDGKVFLDLLFKYKNHKTIQNFITMSLAHLKGMNQMVASRYEALLSAIEKESPNYYGNLTVRVTLEVITMNLLFELDQRVKYKEAQKLLERFSDWDSLISSRLFFTSKAFSPIGRLLFIAKLLCQHKPELTFEILHTPRLHLLDSTDKWPYYNTAYATYDILESDLKFRNEVLRMFLKEGYFKNMSPVTQLYKIVFAKRQGIYKFDEDLSTYFDNMIVDLINKNAVVYLKQIQANIDLLASKMQGDTLRAYICCMYQSLAKPAIFNLYERCVQRGIYQCLYKGDKLTNEILIKTNILDLEIEMIILYYVFKLSEFGHVYDHLKFVIRPPGGSLNNRIDILKTVRSISNISKVIKDALLNLCSLKTKSDVKQLDEIWVDKITLKNYLEGIES